MRTSLLVCGFCWVTNAAKATKTASPANSKAAEDGIYNLNLKCVHRTQNGL